MKNIRKIMAMLVASVIIMGMVTMPTFAEEVAIVTEEEVTESNVFVFDDFERGITEETAITDFKVGTLAAASGVTIVNDPVYGNVLHVNREMGDTGEGDKFVITYSVGGAKKIVSEMDFKINQDVHYMYAAITLCTDGTYGGEDGKAAWEILKKNNMLTERGNIALTDTDFGDEWYSARIIYDIETGKTDWYLAQRGKTPEYVGTRINESKPVPGRFLIAALGQGSEIYVDNLKVYEYEGDVLSGLIAEAEKELRTVYIIPTVATYDTQATADYAKAIADAKTVANNPLATALQKNSAIKAIKDAQKAFILSEGDVSGIAYTRFNLDVHAPNTDVLYGDGSTVNAEVNDTNDADKTIREDFATALNITGNANRVVIDNYIKTPGVSDGFSLGSDVTTIDFAFKMTNKSDVGQLMRVYAGGASLSNRVFSVSSLGGTNKISLDCTDADGNAQSVVFMDSYNTNQWYKIKVVMDFNSRELKVYVDGERALLNNDIYFQGDNVAKWNYSRIETYGPATGTLYLAGIKVIDDRARQLSSTLELIRESLPIDVTKAPQTLCTTANGLDVVWSSSDFTIADNKVSMGTAKDSGTLTSRVTFNGQDYYTNYVLPTAISDYSVDAFELNKDENSYEAVATLKKSSINNGEDISLIIASYNGENKLAEIKITDTSKWDLSAGESASLRSSVTVPDGGTVKAFLFGGATNISPITESIDNAFTIDGEQSVEYKNGKLTFTGQGAITDFDSFEETPWSELAADVTEIEISDGITGLGRSSLVGFENVEKIVFSQDVDAISEGALPENNFIVKGYYNSAAEDYATENGNEFILAGLRILSIGNSHTIDYTTWIKDIQNDLYADGLDTKIEHSRIVYGGRQLYRLDSDRLSHVLVGSDPSNPGYSMYYDLLNSDENTWDIIVLQDWEEAARYDSKDYFADGLATAVRWVKSFQPDAKIAWVMDWPAKNSFTSQSKTLDAVYENILNAKNAVENMTEDKPDYIFSMGTAMQNIRTSYLGEVNNADDAYLNFSDYDWAWNNDPQNPQSYLADYNVLERDVTHCSYELARYSMGVAVYANIFDIYKSDFDLKSGFDFYDALKTAPVTEGAREWKGEFTPSIWNIVKEAAENCVETKYAVTQSVYISDPADEIAQAFENGDYSGIELSDASALAQTLTEIAENKVIVKASDISYTDGVPTVTFLYGYTKKTVKISV